MAALLCVAPARAQTTTADAKAAGRDFGQQMNGTVIDVPTSETTATNNVPGYQGANAPQLSYYSTPDALNAEKASVATTNAGYRSVADGDLVRPRITKSTIDDTIARGNVINQTPATYAQGAGVDGSSGQCVPLPPSSGSPGTYEVTCNTGLKLDQGPKSCPVTLSHQFAQQHKYQCTKLRQVGDVCLQGPQKNCTEPDHVDETIASGCDGFETSSSCMMTQTASVVVAPGSLRTAPIQYDSFDAVCSTTAATGITGTVPTVLKQYPIISQDAGTVSLYQGSTRDESQCATLAADTGCGNTSETCTDSDPVTRVINGVSITQPCWAWTRTYQCSSTSQASDCQSVEATPGCALERSQCLDEVPDPSGACKVWERIYTCPLAATSQGKPQYLCGGDVVCTGGNCEAITRDQDTDFKDAVVGLHSLSEASSQIDQQNLTLFKGTGETCSKPVFGLANCCGGHGFPLIGTCSDQERHLAVEIDKGVTHYVGSYCSVSFLGICTSKRLSFCSFQSKLTRILQEQGRPQLPKSWGSAKTPDCSGFTTDQFAQLDLSKMDFTEIYADFVSAAKLPDEVQVLGDIQSKISDYYARGGH